jgi:hypothetical protein
MIRLTLCWAPTSAVRAHWRLLPSIDQSVSKEFTAERPFVRLVLSSTDVKTKAELHWWNEKERTWKDDPAAELRIKQSEIREKYWAITFEGTFGDRLPAIGSAYLSSFAEGDALGADNKLMLIISVSSLLFAGAGAFKCDRH